MRVSKLQQHVDQLLAGIASVSADLPTQTVVVEGSATVESLLTALTGSGRSARLIGQGSAAGACACHVAT